MGENTDTPYIWEPVYAHATQIIPQMQQQQQNPENPKIPLSTKTSLNGMKKAGDVLLDFKYAAELQLSKKHLLS